MKRFINFILLGWRVHTVTSLDVNFRYPDWVTRVPEFSAEFSAEFSVPPEFSADVPDKKQLSRDRARFSPN